MTRPFHRVEADPVPESPSPARIRAAIARIVRRLNTADDHVVHVFGDGSAADAALEAAVGALRNGDDLAVAERAERFTTSRQALALPRKRWSWTTHQRPSCMLT